MNFFKSILSDDPDPPNSESDPDSPRDPNDADDAWSFGGFVKSFSTQSESVIEAYRRDLQEFGSGLKKETEMLRESASRAVKDLPASLDVVLKSTKESLGFSSDGEPETPGTNRSRNSGRYSRFEAQLSAIQSDSNNFCVEPDDAEDYENWKLGFNLEYYRDEIEFLIEENEIVEGVYRKAVPNAVDHETFWCRYFYRVDKLKQQESVRASIVKMAISNDEEEELSWDVEDEDDDEDGNGSAMNVKGDSSASEGKSNASVDDEKGNVVELSLSEKNCVERDGNDEKVVVEEKVESGNKSDASVVSNQQSEVVAEEAGWDEIGDVGSGDEKKKTSAAARGGGAVEEHDDDDDLNWDIEDDDEPAKNL